MPVMDRDGILRTAYALRETYDTDPHYNNRVMYLDRDLRLVREDRLCESRNQCDRARASWTDQGRLPDLGYGLRTQSITDRALQTVAGDQEVQLPVTVSNRADKTIVTVTTPPGSGFPNQQIHAYSHHRFMPDSTLYMIDGREILYEYRNYASHGLVADADVWPKSLGPPMPAPWQGPLFPGAEIDNFGVGMSHLAILQELQNQSVEAADRLAHGCVVDYQIEPARPAMPSILPNLMETNRGTATIAIANDAGEARAWTMQILQDASGRIRAEPEASSSPATAIAGCAQLKSSPWPTMSVTQFMDRVNDLQLDVGRVLFFEYSLGAASQQVVKPANLGVHNYEVHFVPSSVNENAAANSYDSFAVGMAANHQRFNGVVSTTQDLGDLGK
ncbi:MAG: hypothetical protein AABY18_04350 [Candidatus Thermoplasmatota archaeon]